MALTGDPIRCPKCGRWRCWCPPTFPLTVSPPAPHRLTGAHLQRLFVAAAEARQIRLLGHTATAEQLDDAIDAMLRAVDALEAVEFV